MAVGTGVDNVAPYAGATSLFTPTNDNCGSSGVFDWGLPVQLVIDSDHQNLIIKYTATGSPTSGPVVRVGVLAYRYAM